MTQSSRHHQVIVDFVTLHGSYGRQYRMEGWAYTAWALRIQPSYAARRSSRVFAKAESSSLNAVSGDSCARNVMRVIIGRSKTDFTRFPVVRFSGGRSTESNKTVSILFESVIRLDQKRRNKLFGAVC
jgi:hypothetical protein